MPILLIRVVFLFGLLGDTGVGACWQYPKLSCIVLVSQIKVILQCNIPGDQGGGGGGECWKYSKLY